MERPEQNSLIGNGRDRSIRAASTRRVVETASRAGCLACQADTLVVFDGLKIPVPRHNEVRELTARSIYKQTAEKLGEDWWK